MKKNIFGFAMLAACSMASADLMFNGSDQQVNTGADCMYDYESCTTTTMGYWYDYDDRKENAGSSYTLYPYEADEYGSLIKPMIDNVGYLYVTQVSGAAFEYSFVGMGFNVKDAAQTAYDATAWGGLCITYTSDKPIYLELGADALITDYNAFRISLAAATTPTMVSKAWADFSCDKTWGSCKAGTYTIDQVTSALQAVKVKMEGKGKEFSSLLRIFEVGTAGTCAGAGSIGTETTPKCKSDGDGGLESCSGAAIADVKAASAVKATLSGRTLAFSGKVAGASVEVLNLQGQVMSRSVLSNGATMNLSSLKSGVYMVRVSGAAVNMNQKIVLE